MKECKEEGCNERNYSLGMCKTHYRRFDYYRSRGTTKKMWPKICTADGCEKKAILKGFCNAHYLRNKRLGSPNVPKKYAPPGSGHTTPDGYRKIYVEKRGVMEHRYVMEQKMGRRLIRGETVHHKNGVKSDNCIDNLELWSRAQPAGQRVEDKVSWAIELLRLYKPEVLVK